MMFDVELLGVDSDFFRGEQYTFVEFQPALIPYKATFNSSQARRFLSAIKKHKGFQPTQQHEKIMTISFESIENKINNISSKDPVMSVYFSSNDEGEVLLVISIDRVQKPLDPEIFYLDGENISKLEDMLQMLYIAQK